MLNDSSCASYSIIERMPMPVCVVNMQGKVIGFNDKIGSVFLYDGIKDNDIFALTGVKLGDLLSSAESKVYHVIKRNDRIFRMVADFKGGEDDGELTVFFFDVTNLEELKSRYNGEKPCMAIIQVDNYDELIERGGQNPRLTLSTEIDQAIRRWASRSNGALMRAKDSVYAVWFEQHNLDRIAAQKFDILDEIRALETGTDFPASLSIGVGVGGKNLAQTEEYARAALDLALGRGGDQAVIKRNIKIEYFGGTLQTVEKSNKGKSRIVGHALKQLIEQAKRIFIMGHINPDMDSFGSALGVARLCMMSEKEANIVIGDYSETINEIYDIAKDQETYSFISPEKAISMADEDSLVIVVDTHRSSMVQCPELLEATERIVVIDHHRKMEEYIENTVLAYMESYASSTSELVTEILQYIGQKKMLVKLEAEALLAGITVDTNGFSIKTGVRTFEAAAWLRRQGADPTEVKRLFQEDISCIRIKADGVARAEMYDEGMAVSYFEDERDDGQVLCAQIADTLLTIKDVRASFVLGRNGAGKTVVSARSLGEVNVQVLMEALGGGGHLTTAAAQRDESVKEVRELLLDILEVKEK